MMAPGTAISRRSSRNTISSDARSNPPRRDGERDTERRQHRAAIGPLHVMRHEADGRQPGALGDPPDAQCDRQDTDRKQEHSKKSAHRFSPMASAYFGCGTRSAPWRLTIQPGYSGGSALTSSSRFISSAESVSLAASRLSSSCSMVLAPMITLITKGLAST